MKLVEVKERGEESSRCCTNAAGHQEQRSTLTCVLHVQTLVWRDAPVRTEEEVWTLTGDSGLL